MVRIVPLVLSLLAFGTGASAKSWTLVPDDANEMGPILVGLTQHRDLHTECADDHIEARVRNADLVDVLDHGSGLVGVFAAGCPILLAHPLDRVRTIAGMEDVARPGDLCFNLHTASQTFDGDIRGQLRPLGEMTATRQKRRARETLYVRNI